MVFTYTSTVSLPFFLPEFFFVSLFNFFTFPYMGKGPSLQEAVARVAAGGHEIIIFRAVTTAKLQWAPGASFTLKPM